MNYIFPFRKYGLFIADAPYVPYRLKVNESIHVTQLTVGCKSYYVIVNDDNGDKRCHTSVNAMNINLRCLMERFPLSSIPEKPPEMANFLKTQLFFFSIRNLLVKKKKYIFFLI